MIIRGCVLDAERVYLPHDRQQPSAAPTRAAVVLAALPTAKLAAAVVALCARLIRKRPLKNYACLTGVVCGRFALGQNGSRIFFLLYHFDDTPALLHYAASRNPMLEKKSHLHYISRMQYPLTRAPILNGACVRKSIATDATTSWIVQGVQIVKNNVGCLGSAEDGFPVSSRSLRDCTAPTPRQGYRPQGLKGRGSSGGGGVGGGQREGVWGFGGLAGGGGFPRWGGLRATHYYHMHTSRGDVCLGVWGYGGMYVIIALSRLCREESLKGRRVA